MKIFTMGLEKHIALHFDAKFDGECDCDNLKVKKHYLLPIQGPYRTYEFQFPLKFSPNTIIHLDDYILFNSMYLGKSDVYVVELRHEHVFVEPVGLTA